MTKRDRIVISVILSVGVLAAMWFIALGPKRSESSKLDAKITLQQGRLVAAQQGTDQARNAKARYESDYAAVARLGQAVPADENTPSLVYELDTAANRAQVDFRALRLQAGTAGAPAAAPAPAALAGTDTGAAPAATGASGAAGAAVAPAPPPVTVGEFPTMPFSFDLEGSFFHLEAFLRRVAQFTAVKGQKISVSGRLVSVTGVNIAASKKGFPRISATVNATAYLLPASEGLLNGATPAAPALATTTPAAPGAPAPSVPVAPAAAALATGGGK